MTLPRLEGALRDSATLRRALEGAATGEDRRLRELIWETQQLALACRTAPPPEEDFFELGGHSLPALMLLYRISSQFKKTISIQDFSRNPTVSSLAHRIEGGGAS